MRVELGRQVTKTITGTSHEDQIRTSHGELLGVSQTDAGRCARYQYGLPIKSHGAGLRSSKRCCGGNCRSTPMEVWEPPRYRQTGRLYRCLHRPHCANEIFLIKCDRCSHGSSRVGVSARSGPDRGSNASWPKPNRGSSRAGSAPSRRLSIGTGIARTVFEAPRVRLLPKWMEILDGLIPSNHP